LVREDAGGETAAADRLNEYIQHDCERSIHRRFFFIDLLHANVERARRQRTV